jgi:peptide/nickel transport system ATP-binding protein
MSKTLLSVQGLVKHFPLKKDVLGRGGGVVRAVDGVEFAVHSPSCTANSTPSTARLLMHLIEPTAGTVVFDGQAVGTAQLPLKAFRRQVQMVFQDSYASLNPRLTIEDSVAFGPQVHGMPAAEAVAKGRDLLARVGLDPTRFAERYPHELSGGQRQRVNIARALALSPRVVILDEAVSALDKSVEAQVLNLLLDLKDEFGLTYVFISHDLNVVRYVSDRVMVMYLGEVAEIGPAEQLFERPRHPYTGALLNSMPSMDPDHRTLVAPLAGDPPNPINPPAGCRFHPRCPKAEAVCGQRAPSRQGMGADGVACLMFEAGSGHSAARAAA